MVPREQREGKDQWAQQERMANKAQLVLLETEVLQEIWVCQAQKALQVMLGRLERLEILDLQVKGVQMEKMERRVLPVKQAQLVQQEREESRDLRE